MSEAFSRESYLGWVASGPVMLFAAGRLFCSSWRTDRGSFSLGLVKAIWHSCQAGSWGRGCVYSGGLGIGLGVLI